MLQGKPPCIQAFALAQGRLEPRARALRPPAAILSSVAHLPASAASFVAGARRLLCMLANRQHAAVYRVYKAAQGSEVDSLLVIELLANGCPLVSAGSQGHQAHGVATCHAAFHVERSCRPGRAVFPLQKAAGVGQGMSVVCMCAQARAMRARALWRCTTCTRWQQQMAAPNL
jgi:hypothetical protein